ncbi:NAD(P)H-hydrate dehydratase [Roseobacter sp. HKCCD9010]|uniref:NAD(P)H-hydrate dehydratase n=1 Tax=unclassified Roseobacter TaxID=196798 RepID=UPI001490EC38|nr:NAD(P)H-hydrate dehydratase [Rhodobacterales bacterium HKCCD4356]NNV11752.1 NAD(P)H-hydrate dehydratase [Roseobacter sp. HKCCD7357]NNV15936.1 NAD(P)H-hydrate dehydratase [Roseobacter sp. HKCCD8768]NNV25396.1 NAD(P)H-hydrate dehydratase [Roseobacter sp. HKCCD8192]NNV29653.1 NAD(P)H-hydrate dehydratase [Roseobacter sp. HKCCD9061]NNV33926.1 NAD(P)H-hydrate dehydratase [Roseobacter sp. HKCCD9073]NNV38176.1 NAD(P)H-hydrate dehydratase [Roseobacter sp. HKCCD9054]NNV42133.1 NAD(P)H-hydrate dehyd
MTELLTAAQMRAIETAAIESGQVTGLELMERAGRGVVEAVFEEWPELAAAPHKAVVLCGPGNNGGDGFVVARLLKEWGWEVEVFLYGDPDKLPPDAKVNYERWVEMGEVSVYAVNLPSSETNSLVIPQHVDLLVDALFGTGLIRPFQGPFTIFAEARDFLRDSSERVVALDIPSGVCSDSGRVLGTAIPADLTVTFHREKIGHRASDGADISGKTSVKSIGLEGASGRAVGGNLVVPPGNLVRLADGGDAAMAAKESHQHKYTHGHAVILSGPMGHSGAARLAARGALRVGAGLVTVAAPESAMMECAAQLTVIMLRKCDGADGLAAVLEDERINALCLGPGMGVGTATREVVAVALQSERSVVLDADALTSFEAEPEAFFALLHDEVVLTPHAGEFARLFPDIAEKLNAIPETGPAYSKVDATREAAARAGCVVLFKGPDTVIAGPSGRCAINSAAYDRAAPWLATAGAGDVLAGFISGLMARGLDAIQAAEAGAWLHVECARMFGPGLIAEDLPEMLPKVFRTLEGAGAPRQAP